MLNVKDVKLNEKQPTVSYWNVMYLTRVKAFFFAIFSAASFYQFLGSTPFEIARDIYGQQIKSIWCVWKHVHNEEACGVRIHSTCLSISSVFSVDFKGVDFMKVDLLRVVFMKRCSCKN